MKKRFRAILTLLLVVVMCASFLPTMAFAQVYEIGSTNNNRLNVIFMSGSTKKEDVFVKSADEVADVVYDPGADVPSGKVFRGWTTKENYTAADAASAMTIDKVQADVKSKLPASTDGQKVTYYAMFFDTYTVKYLDEGGIVLKTDTYLAKTKGTDQVDYTISMAYSPSDPTIQKFLGWKVKEGAANITSTATAPYSNGTAATIKGDVTFEPDAPYGNWLIFDEKGGTYTVPQFVKEDEKPTKPANPTKKGYDFDYWYVDDESVEFNFNNTLTETTTVHAKWNEHETAEYTVLIWKQNVEGTGYDFADVKHGEGNVHSYINALVSISGDTATVGDADDSTRYTYDGFTPLALGEEQVEIVADGSGTLNIYFDRKMITLNFYTWTNIPDDYVYTEVTGTAGASGRYYTSTTANNTTQVYYNDADGKWYTQRQWDYWNWQYNYSGASYATVYTRSNAGGWGWHLYKTISGLYSSTVGSEWPDDYDWYATGGDNGSTSGTRTTFLDAYLPPAPGVTVMNFYGTDHGGNQTVHFLQQNASGNGYTEANSVKANGRGTFYISDKYNGFHAAQYATNANGPWTDLGDKNSQGYYGSVSNFTDLYIRFDRDKYSINFMDGLYVDAKANFATEPGGDKTGINLSTVDNVVYGSKLTDYSTYKPAAISGYAFDGWYLDKACQNKCDFSTLTMPAGGLTVYARWVKTQYRVILHANLPTNPAIQQVDSGTPYFGITAWSFRANEGEEISVSNGVAKNYEFMGWYLDEACETTPFNQDAHKAISAIASSYDKTTVASEGDINGPIAGEEQKDLTGYNGGERFWITQKIDVYAKWRSKTIGADGINVVYNATGVYTDGETAVAGSNAPTDSKLYKDKATAYAGPASTATPEDKQFLYWRVDKWSNGEYVDSGVKVYPGATFDVLAANAKIEDLDNGNAVIAYANVQDDGHYKYTVQLTAVYGDKGAPVKVIVKYEPNGGTITGNAQEEVLVNTKITLPTVTREGFTFLGWGYKTASTKKAPINRDGETAIIPNNQLTLLIPAADVTKNWAADKVAANAWSADDEMNILYAMWDYGYLKITKTFAGDIGENEVPTPLTITATLQEEEAASGDEGGKKAEPVTVNFSTSDTADDGLTIDGLTYTWIKQVATGTYVITEGDASATGYNLATTYNPATQTTGNAAATSATQTVNSTDNSTEETAAEVTITNTYTAKPGTLTVTKTFSGITEAEIPNGFAITGAGTTDLTIATADEGSAFPTYTWTVEDLAAGEYTIAESAATVTGYALETKYDDTVAESKAVTLEKAGTASVAITNTYTAQPGTLTVTKTFSGITEAEIPNGFAITGAGTTDLTIATADEGSAFPTYTWTVEDLAAGEYTIAESAATVTGYALETKYDDTVAESKAVTLEKAGTASVAITNTYTSQIGYLTVTKTFAGDITDEDSIPSSFAIKVGSKSLTIADADEGSAFPTYTWTVEMAAGNYKLTESANISGYTLESELSTEEVEVIAGDDNAKVEITNTYTKKDTPPPPPPPELDYVDHYGYMVGYPDGTVRPAGNITRAEVATIFFRLLTDESREELWCTENPFSDVNSEDWFNNAVSTMYNAGIVSGYPDGTFRPNAKITRAELATIVARFLEDRISAGVEINLSDISGHWAEGFIIEVAENGIINGYPDGTFKPDQAITRAETVTMINRLLQRKPDKEHLLDNMIVWPDIQNTEAWYYEAIQEATNSHEYYYSYFFESEIWETLLPMRDWSALEKEWADWNSGTQVPGDPMPNAPQLNP